MDVALVGPGDVTGVNQCFSQQQPTSGVAGVRLDDGDVLPRSTVVLALGHKLCGGRDRLFPVKRHPCRFLSCPVSV